MAAGAPRLTTIPGGGVTSARGFRAGAVYAGIKTPGRGKLDVGIVASDAACTVAAMFTRNRVKAAAVLLSQRHARNGRAQAIVVNAGISNVATGERGARHAADMARYTAEKLGIVPTDVLVGSTGVIGRPLPIEQIRDGIAGVKLAQRSGNAFARAIMTTDTRAKEVAVRYTSGGRTYTIGGCAKGSGMIHPDMATMFCWLTTDAPVAATDLRRWLRSAVDDSLNMISIDGDTSTSDTVAVLANGAAGGNTLRARTPAGWAFEAALRHVCVQLARMLARDGEGAERLIEVRVEGAASLKEARAAARTVSASPLVKTAVHGADPNWGRVLMAVGRSGARLTLDRARVWLGRTLVFSGVPRRFDEAAASAYLRGEEVVLRIDLGTGGGHAATAWGCDLTPDYVHINSDYTT